LRSVYHDPAYRDLREALKRRLHDLQARLGDKRYPKDVD